MIAGKTDTSPLLHPLSTGSYRNLLIAGAIPPTDPGPGMFPATAAAWAAAAA